MSETVIPTMSLRFVKRRAPGNEYEVEPLMVKVLQQLFQTSKGPEWRDVPLVDEDK